MALRNCDIDSAIRNVLEGSREDAKALAALAAAKLAECGKKPNGDKAVTKVPRHAGRRNPLAGKPKGSGDVNLRGIIDWIDSIPAGDESDEVQAALESLTAFHATAAAFSA